MAKKYYLIPFETDEVKKQGMLNCPKYLNELGMAQGLISSKDQDGKHIQDYYLVTVYDEKNQALIEKHEDVILIDAETKLESLDAINVDTKSIDVRSVEKHQQIQAAVTKWLIGEEKLIAEAIA